MSSAAAAMLEPISDEEIAWVCAVMRLPPDAFCGQNGADPRLMVMRSLETLDVEACPGSGKTTLLVAKLAILANRWRSRRQGICVLSHTNAARSEIGERLSSTSAGHLLLRPPHFVGTIHSFVNEFLALPWLRSKSWPIKAIDSHIAFNDRWWRLPINTRTYLDKQHTRPVLDYTRPDFSGGGKDDYPKGKSTFDNMQTACRQSTEAGLYTFDEMFVWADELLDRRPDVAKSIRERFPLVFIDEVQDNSELQSTFLHRLFMAGDEPVKRQRFGDSNQAIYHRTGASGAVTDTFPGMVKTDLPNSFRFGQEIANLADPLGVRPQKLVGRGPTESRVTHADRQSALLLFDEQSMQEVLPVYAQYLIDSFSPETLALGNFTAVAAVHRSDKNDHPPRFMGDYAPGYDPDVSGRQPRPDSLAKYLARARMELATSRNTHPIANRFAEGVLQLARDAGAEIPLSIRQSANRYILEKLEAEDPRKVYLGLLDLLIMSRCDISKESWTTIIAPAARLVAETLAAGTLTEPGASNFLAWVEIDRLAVGGEGLRRDGNLFHYPPADPKVTVRLGSIHSVKGETHTATLVLESFNKTHHLKKLLPWLTGKRPKKNADNTNEDSALKERLKLHYVAMTRPSHLLCIAMRKDAFKAADLDLIRSRNWLVIECPSPAPADDE